MECNGAIATGGYNCFMVSVHADSATIQFQQFYVDSNLFIMTLKSGAHHNILVLLLVKMLQIILMLKSQILSTIHQRYKI